MDDGRCASVQKVKTLEDLPAPATQHLRLHHLETLQVPAADSAIISRVHHVEVLGMLPIRNQWCFSGQKLSECFSGKTNQ